MILMPKAYFGFEVYIRSTEVSRIIYQMLLLLLLTFAAAAAVATAAAATVDC
jgi:hypothetical protein